MSYIYQPRKGSEVLLASPPGTRIFLYSQLARGNPTPEQTLSRLSMYNLILLQDPRKMNTGHWTCLTINPRTKQAFFFSSYGGKPDEEKNRWMTRESLIMSGQSPNVINDALKYLYMRGWEIHYNDHRYQIEGDETATCGIWASAFMRSGENPDEFERDHKPVGYYYSRDYSKNE